MIDIQPKVKENLSENLIIDNYKKLCDLLDIKVSSGNSKKSQLENLSRYVEYEKDGNKFVITKIFDDPKPAIDNRNKGGNTEKYIYQKYLEIILLQILSKEDKQELTITKKTLMHKLGMINENYIDEKRRKILLADKSKSYTKHDMNMFDNRAYQILDRILFSTLDRLQKVDILSYRKQLHIKQFDNNDELVERVATKEEEDTFRDIKYAIRKEMGIKEGDEDKYFKPISLYFNHKEKEFYELLGEKLFDDLEWESTCIKYKITYKLENVIESIDRSVFQLNKIMLNDKILLAFDKNAKSTFARLNAKFEEAYEKLLDTYVGEVWDGEEVMREVIRDWLPLSEVKAYKPHGNFIQKQKELSDDLIKIS